MQDKIISVAVGDIKAPTPAEILKAFKKQVASRRFKMTQDEYQDATNDYLGFCRACGESQDQCEPDAREYKCEACGELQVYGVEELLMMGQVEIAE